jgi:hypothetical protein
VNGRCEDVGLRRHCLDIIGVVVVLVEIVEISGVFQGLLYDIFSTKCEISVIGSYFQ